MLNALAHPAQPEDLALADTPTADPPKDAHKRVRALLERAFDRKEREVLKTQNFDLAPGGQTDPDRLYQPVAEAALSRARCQNVLADAELDVVEAYWTARGLAKERQAEYARWRAAGVPDDQIQLRTFTQRETELWRLKDRACVRLIRPVQEQVGRRTRSDMVLDLIREWAGVLDPGQRVRLADYYEQDPSTVRRLKAGRPDRGKKGVQPVLEALHSRALDWLAQHLAPADLDEGSK